MNWYDKALQQIEEDFEAGLLSGTEYFEMLGDLDEAPHQAAGLAADGVYYGIVGY